MARIPSPNPDLPGIVSGGAPAYRHPVDARDPRKPDNPIPMAFQVTSPFNPDVVLLPHALVLHVNPMSLQESHNQKKEVFQTRGGFVEQHWGQELMELSADQSTGAFMNIKTGLTSVLRQRTIAWDRFRDLHDLFRNNGSVHDPFGNIVLQGQILLMFDRGLYYGSFRSFQYDETEDSPFAFKLSWTFKVERTVLAVDDAYTFFGPAPEFQTLNAAAEPPNTTLQNRASNYQTGIRVGTAAAQTGGG